MVIRDLPPAVVRLAPSLLLAALIGCAEVPRPAPTIEFTAVPSAAEGGPDKLTTIAGRVRGARSGQRVVLYARSGVWWIQPLAANPFTAIQSDSTWKSDTHFGFEYAALLVEPGYNPSATLDELPGAGGPVAAVASVKGVAVPDPPTRRVRFSGYEWEVRQTASERGGTFNIYDPGNVWVDADGFLHLRIAPREDAKPGEPVWSSAEASLTRSLGYGTYLFVVRDTAHLEPAAVFSVFTWDLSGDDPGHREMDIELTQWGDATSKNAQFVVQPYYVPANVVRFTVPRGVMTHSLRWLPGRALFRSVRGGIADAGAQEVAAHEFTGGVPSAGTETIRLNLYVFGHTQHPLRKGAEVIVEKFVYLP